MWSQNKRIDQGDLMSMQIILAGLGIFALLGAYVMFKLKHAHREIEQLLKPMPSCKRKKPWLKLGKTF